MAVAIRSGIFRGRIGRLYAGAGLLAESQPEVEWEETSLKFRPMLEALGLFEEPLWK
jgi:menaquinone-specific isochorismate synthase